MLSPQVPPELGPKTLSTTYDETLLRLVKSQTLVNGDLKDSFEEITEAVTRCLDVERVSVWLFADDRRMIQCKDLFERSKGQHSEGPELLAEQFPNYFLALLQNRPVAADDAPSDPRTREFKEVYLDPLGITSMLDVPIWQMGENVGVVCHEHTGRPRTWTEEEKTFAAAVANLVAVSLEVNKRKEVETALQESNSIHQTLIDQIRAATYVEEMGKSGVVTYVSPRIEELTGFTAAEWIGRPGFVSRVHPDDSDSVEKELARAKKTGKFEAVYRFYDRNRNIRWLHDKAVIIKNESGDPVWQGCVFDVSELKASQEDKEVFVSLIEGSSELICVVSTSGALRTLNKAGQRIVGGGRKPRHLASIMSKTSFIQFEKEIIPTIQKGVEWSGPFELKHCTTSEVIPVEMCVFRIGGDENAQDVAIVARDVKRRRSVEEELRESQEQLRQSQKLEAIGTLAGGIAHDFNNMLTTIRGHCEMLQRDLSDDGHRSRVDGIITICDRAASQTRQLLTFSRRQVLQPVLLDLNAALLDMEKLLGHLIGENIELVLRQDPALGFIKADPTGIEQVIMNLAINARDAMPGGGKLVLETKNIYMTNPIGGRGSVGEVTRYVSLVIKDAGTGMAEHIKNRIFEPFFSTKKAVRGTGLGLSTVYGIIKESGGEIQVVSKKGEGSTFRMYFPRIDDKGGKSYTLGRKKTSHKTILLAEDEDDLREIIGSFLKDEGYTALLARDGDQALSILESFKGDIDLLLTDVVMPKAEGCEVAKRFLEKFSKGRVIYMSGYQQESQLFGAQEDYDFLAKPFALDRLARRIKDILSTTQ